MQTLNCRACGNDWEREPRRGRVPQICPTCAQAQGRKLRASETTNVNRKLTAQQRVDRLERMLKASGVHISQHSKDDE